MNCQDLFLGVGKIVLDMRGGLDYNYG